MLAPFHTHPLLSHARIAHGFFGREGGVSRGLYASLNCGLGSGDVRADVVENRARAVAALGLGEATLCTLYQIHSPRVVTLDAPWEAAPPEADGLVTSTPGLALGILTADCAPVLFADVSAGVIGAAHAGWKGATDGVLEATIAAMEALGAARARIAAVIGPTIAQPSYEVGPEFFSRFDAPAQKAFFMPSTREGHHYFNLPGYVTHRLRNVGIREVAALGHDTAARTQHYFSYRRTTLAGEPDYGRQMSVVGLRE
jgi:YfiH family protein